MVLRLNTTLSGLRAEIHPQIEDPSLLPPALTGVEKLGLAIQDGLRDLSDPAFLGPMMVAQGVFGLSRLGLLKIFPKTFSKGGALVTANLGAFGLEGLAFVGSTRGVNHAMGRAPHPDADFSKELGHAYLTLGLLKGLGGLTNSALQLRYQKIPAIQWGWQDRLLLKGAPQASAFGGIYLSHTLAPHLGLGEYIDPADRLVQSAVSLVHFGAAGLLMNRIPGYTAANQRIHRETHRLIQGRWDSFNFGSVALTPEGMEMPVPAVKNPASTHIVKMSIPDGINGKRPSIPPPSTDSIPPPSDSIPPPPSIPPPSFFPPGSGPESIRQSLRPPIGNGNGHGNGNGNGNGFRTKLKDKVGGLGTTAKVLSNLEILNRFSDPQQAPRPVKREVLPPSVKNVKEGKLRAMARGLGQRQVWEGRFILDHTLELPETREAYLEMERDRQAFHKGMGERLDPILEKFDTPTLKALQDGVIRYREEIERALGKDTSFFEADGLINLFHARRIADPEFRAALTEADLIAMGYEPRTFKWARDHGDKYWPGALEALIKSHPELANAPGADKVLNTARNFRFELLDPENLSHKAGQLKTAMETYSEKVNTGQLTLSEEQMVHWEKANKFSRNFDPKKITSPKGKEEQAALERAEALFLTLEDFFRTFQELPAEWGELKRAKEEFPAPNPFINRGGKNMKGALGRFLKNEKLAPIWLSETALHHSLREMMRRKSDTFLHEVLLEVQSRELENLPPEEAKLISQQVQEFHRARELFEAQKLWAESGRYSNIHGLLDGLARVVGKRDFGPYHRAQGEYERVVQDLLLDYESFLIPAARRVLGKKLELVDPLGMDLLVESRERLMNRFEDHAQEYRKVFETMETEVEELIEYYDTSMVALRERGMRVGMLHLKELAQRVGLPSILNPKIFNWETQFELLIQGRTGKERGKPIDPEKDPVIIGYFPAAEKGLKGMINPRDLERNTEEPLKLIMEGYDEIRKIARGHKVDLGEIHPILPMFEPFAFKSELLQELRRRLPVASSHRFDNELPKLGALKFRDWQRFKMMLRYGMPAWRILRVGAVQNHGYPFAEGARQFLDFGAHVGESANSQTFYNQKGIEEVADYFRFAVSGDHNVHLDFIGNAGNVVQAMLGPYAHRLSITDIIAKLDLKIPVIETVFPYLTNMIGNGRHQTAMAFQRASRMQALGGLEFERMHPTMPLGYDNITMDITNGEGPYVRDPASPVTGSLPVMGRLFGISEGAAVLTGRPQAMVFAQDPGALRNFPAQRANDRKAALLNNPSNMATLFIPTSALPEPRGHGKITYRNNLQRLIWYLQAFHPELDPGAPDTDALFYRDYKKPLDPETERIVAQLYAGAGELYPTAQSMRELEARRQELNQQIDPGATFKPASERALHDLNWVNKAMDQQTRQILGNRLTVLDQQLTRELRDHPHIPEAKALRRHHRMIQDRLKIFEQVEKKFSTGEALTPAEKNFLHKALVYYSGKTTVEARDPLMDQVEFYFANRYPEGGPVGGQQAHPQAHTILGTMETVIELVSSSHQPHKQEILGILKARQKKLVRAFAQFNLGEPLTPVEQILIENMAGSNSRKENPPVKDALVSAILSNHITPEQMEKILKAERIRETRRALIEKLPGGGRGTIDSIAESSTDAAQVMFNSAGEVVAGPKSKLATYNFLAKFSVYPLALGVLGALDLQTKGRFDFYSMASPFIARHAMASVKWRPFLTSQDVRVLEDLQIEAEGLLEGTVPRPFAIAANHASWTDITTLMAVYPKMRFAYKKELLKIPGLKQALLLGRHTGIDRPLNNTAEERERAFAQVQKSGEWMIETGLAPTFFHSGTRSLSGVPGAPKDGIAHLAMPTNALILGVSIFGTRQILDEAGKAFSAGMGVDRKIGIGFTRVDPREIVDLDAVLAQRDSAKVTVKAGKQISDRIHQGISDRFVQQLSQLQEEARRGDAMAQAQLAEQIAAIEKGMELVREGDQTHMVDGETGQMLGRGDYHHAKVWAKENKTDFNTLKKITAWWDASSSVGE